MASVPSFISWPVGLMDKASASGAGDSKFESWAGHLRRACLHLKLDTWRSCAARIDPDAMSIICRAVMGTWIECVAGSSPAAPHPWSPRSWRRLGLPLGDGEPCLAQSGPLRSRTRRRGQRLPTRRARPRALHGRRRLAPRRLNELLPPFLTSDPVRACITFAPWPAERRRLAAR